MSSTNENRFDDFDRQLTDEAWNKLQLKLANEPVQTKWLSWPAQASNPDEQTQDSFQATTGTTDPAAETSTIYTSTGTLEKELGSGRNQSGRLFPAWLHKRRKWVGAAAACFLFAAIVATPTGNKALASILNKFRVQDITVVQEQDFRNFFNQISPDGNTREQINKFGTFTQTVGTLEGKFEPVEAEKILGHKLVTPAGFEIAKDQIYISPSTKLTFQIKVDEVNKAIKRLGGTKLLPASIDGKSIALDLKESVHIYLRDNTRNDKKQPWASFTQLAVPVLTVDPSVPVSEAIEALLDFPMLPSNLKQALQNSRILDDGGIPLPVVAYGATEQISINGTKVLLDTRKLPDYTQYNAIWIREGQLLDFQGGNMFTDKAVFLDKIKELIGS